MQKNKIVGIDLGTTNSLVSFVKDGKPRIIPNERGSRTTPSVVSFKDDGQVVVGEMAKNQAILNSAATVMNVKLAMGTEKIWQIGDNKYLPEEISGHIIAHLKNCAENYLGYEVEEAVITVPAYFDDNQRQATLKSAVMAGLKVQKLLNEPTAAALTYGLGGQEDNARLMVLDLGGGTFDITLMEYENEIFRVKATGGSTSLGGLNFDQHIIEHILQQFTQTSSYNLENDPVAFQQIVIQAERAKIDLSSAQETAIMIPYIAVSEDGPIHLNQKFSLSIFNELIAPVLADMKKYILEVFDQSGLGPEWVDRVILTGGATRVPAVESLIASMLAGSDETPAEAVKRLLGHRVNPDEAVARGAGILAAIMSGEMADIEFHDITSHNLGLEDDEGKFVNIIASNTPYPCQVSRLFTTIRDNQHKVSIHILQDRGHADDRKLVFLGLFELDTGGDRPRGEPNIDVSFTIDLNGVLTVKAMDLDSGLEKNIIIHANAECNLSIT